ncbi:MAG: hypothetical protein JSU64_06595 [candidate division WOR-3 bacterium]|nr:MAG: hypothetical protein JSU64_06595 [candidate division WOR-3 bacterium]
MAMLLEKEVCMMDGVAAERNRIVVRFKDGRLLKGFTHDFTPVKDSFHLTSESEGDQGKIYEVFCPNLKAIFFVKTLNGDVNYKEKKRFDEVDTSGLRGIKIKVEFNDGEVLRGISLGYSRTRKGFFVIPVDPDSNNERVYVISNAVRDVKLGSAAEK